MISALNLSAGLALSGAVEQIESAIEAAISNGWGKKFDSATVAEGSTQLGNKTKSQLVAEQNVFKQLVITVIAAECDPTLKETDETFMDSVCEHMAMLFVSNAVRPEQPVADRMDHDSIDRPRSMNLKILETTLFLDALMKSLESPKQVHLKATLKTIGTFIDAVLILTRDEVDEIQAAEDTMEKKPTPKKSKKKTMDVDESSYPKLAAFIEALLPRLVHCCYKQEAHCIIGGVAGLDRLCKSLPTSILKSRLPDILPAIMRAIQLLPVYAMTQKKEAEEVFLRIIERSIPSGSEPPTVIEGDSGDGVAASVSILLEELRSVASTCACRTAVEKALLGIAERTSTTMESILSQSKSHLTVLLEKPLQTRHVLAQLQLVKFVDFCLIRSPSLIPLKDMSVQTSPGAFFNAVLLVAESDDNTVLNVETQENESLSTLRQSCVKVLSTALSTPEFSKSDSSADIVAVRERISTVLFTRLTSRNGDIVAIAKRGMVEVKPHMN